MRFIFVFIVLLAGATNSVAAKEVGNACLSSDRGAGQLSLCSCIQKAADQTLSRRDQKRAASFFADPDLAQTTRRSDTKRDEAFWERYQAFGDVARKHCRKR
ncbi:MAG: hypothetical protein ABJF50_21795 [Paracoccaceae bacterium]